MMSTNLCQGDLFLFLPSPVLDQSSQNFIRIQIKLRSMTDITVELALYFCKKRSDHKNGVTYTYMLKIDLISQ